MNIHATAMPRRATVLRMTDCICHACKIPMLLIVTHGNAHNQMEIFECARCKSRASVTTFPAYRTSPIMRDYVARQRANRN